MSQQTPKLQPAHFPLSIDREGMEAALGKKKFEEIERLSLKDTIGRIEREQEKQVSD